MVSRNFVIFPPSAVKDPSTIASQGLKVKKNDSGVLDWEMSFVGAMRIALLSEEGSMIAKRSCEGWFQSRNLQDCALGTTPRGIRFAIPLPIFLDGCALSGLHSLRS
jgi:hypothetical protein